MEYEFDKEIDAILRKARGGEVATSLESHLDADEIAAFAENALPETVRQSYTAHFADCTKCRRILSSVILLNSEAETEAASSTVTVETVKEETPWYRRFFAFPQIAYTMGGLVLLFSGFFGYLILQNLSPAERTVSYSANTANRAAPQTAPYAASNSNTAANTTFPAANSSALSNATTTTTNSATLSASNSNTTVSTAEQKAARTENEPLTEAPMAAPEPKPTVKDEADEKPAKVVPSAPIDQPNAAGAVREERKQDKNENQYSVDGQSADASRDDSMLKTQRSAPMSAKKKSNEAGAARSVGGKTFNNVGGIWFDAAYTKQKTINVTRGSDDYQKLDAGLRSIADQLGGTVVVLWNGKAYRIQ